MATITVRVSDKEKEWFQYMAEFHGVSLSDLMKNYSMSQLEDEYDAETGKAAYKLWVKEGKQSEPIEKVMKDLNIFDEK